MNERDYIIAGLESLLAKAYADVKHLELELARRRKLSAPKPNPTEKRKGFVRSAKARKAMSNAQKLRYAKKLLANATPTAAPVAKAASSKKR